MIGDTLNRLKEVAINYDLEGAVKAPQEAIRTGFNSLKAKSC